MPYVIGPMTRRSALLALGGALGSAVVGCRAGLRRAPERVARVVFLSDPHIAADPATRSREGVNMHDRLAAVVAEVAELDPAPDLVICNGDNAYDDGQPGDYATYARLLRPLADAGLNVAVTLGNHDDRAAFRAAFAPMVPAASAVPDRHALVVEVADTSLVLLDSLDVVDETPGELGPGQRAWLDAALAEAGRRGRRAVVVLHHPPVSVVPGERVWALRDEAAFWAVVRRHAHVGAVVHGHTHRWEPRVHGPSGVPVVGLPATAYTFRAQDTPGYAVGTFAPGGWSMRLIPRFGGPVPARSSVTFRHRESPGSWNRS